MTSIASLPSGRVIVDQIDPQNLVAGGTDTCIHDLIKYCQSTAPSLIGITANENLKLGEWIRVPFAGKEIDFMPVAFLDRSAPKKWFSLPHSILTGMGIIRHRRRIPRNTLQAHRVETGAILSFLKPRRLIQYIHNDSRGLTGANSDSVWKYAARVYGIVETRVCHKADQIVLFNEPDSHRLRKKYRDLTVARTWFDPEVFTLSRSKWKPGDRIDVLFVGRLDTQKDPILALEAFKALRKIYPNSKLKFVGAGPLEGKLIKRVNELGLSTNVEFAGTLSRAGVAREMSRSTVMILTSFYEGSPRVVAEAGAVGLPVVATVEADTDKVLGQETQNGARVASRQAADIAEQIVVAATYDPKRCAEQVAGRSGPVAVNELLGS